jgi:XRE family transcriptional regulator, master regulator for biofilm formation
MLIGDRIRAIRERKQLSQVELAVRAGLVRSYISGVENGYIVPSVETMEKIVQVLEVPLHRLFYDGDEAPPLPNLPNRLTADDIALGILDEEKLTFVKRGQRVHTPVAAHGPARIHICVSKSCRFETRYPFGHRDSHRDIIMEGPRCRE